MRTEYLPISNLKTTVSVGGDIDVELVQRDTVGVTCVIESGNRPARVIADDGIEFASANGLRVSLQDGADITDLCDLAAIEADIAWLIEERAEAKSITRRAARHQFAAA